jgi:hypothetical protein
MKAETDRKEWKFRCKEIETAKNQADSTMVFGATAELLDGIGGQFGRNGQTTFFDYGNEISLWFGMLVALELVARPPWAY